DAGAVVLAGQAGHPGQGAGSADPLDSDREQAAGLNAIAELAEGRGAPAVDSAGGQQRAHGLAFADQAGHLAEGAGAARVDDGYRGGGARGGGGAAQVGPGHRVVTELTVVVETPAGRAA